MSSSTGRRDVPVLNSVREWIARLWSTLRPARHDGDLEDELRLHAELAAESARRRGGSADDPTHPRAIAAADVRHAVEAMREQRGLPWLDDGLRDVRYAARLLKRQPAFTLVAS